MLNLQRRRSSMRRVTRTWKATGTTSTSRVTSTTWIYLVLLLNVRLLHNLHRINLRGILLASAKNNPSWDWGMVSSRIVDWASVDVEPCIRSLSKRPAKAEIRSMWLLHSLRASFLRNSFFHVLETSLERLWILHHTYRWHYLSTLADFIGTDENCDFRHVRCWINY